MIVEKIISGGQTGADPAALDVALEYGIPHGGWVSRGRRNEKGILPNRYCLKELSSKEKLKMARMKKTEFSSLEDSLGKHIAKKFGLSTGNAPLIQSCGEISGKKDLKKAQAAAVIIRELWKRLQETHALRIVK